MLVLYNDCVVSNACWPAIRANGLRCFEQIRAAGGRVEVMNLPERRIRRNIDMIMMDRNGDNVARSSRTGS